jgi:hypothetical protein
VELTAVLAENTVVNPMLSNEALRTELFVCLIEIVNEGRETPKFVLTLKASEEI